MLTLCNIDFRAVLRNFILLLDKGCISGPREPKVFPPKLEIHWAQISVIVSPRSFSGLSLPPCRCPSQVLDLSLFKGREFVEGMPEEGWLPLGFCQGKNLLLRDAGRHSDVALMNRMQALVWRRHRTPVIAYTCKSNSLRKHRSQLAEQPILGKFKHRTMGQIQWSIKPVWILPWSWMVALLKVTFSDVRLFNWCIDLA